MFDLDKAPKFFHSRFVAYVSMMALLGGFFYGLWVGEFIDGQGTYVTVFGGLVAAWFTVANAREYKDKELVINNHNNNNNNNHAGDEGD